MFINSSLIDKKSDRDDINVFYVPASETGIELGSAKVANIVILGAYLEQNGVISEESVMAGIKKVLGERKASFLPLNEQAIKRGKAAVI